MSDGAPTPIEQISVERISDKGASDKANTLRFRMRGPRGNGPYEVTIVRFLDSWGASVLMKVDNALVCRTRATDGIKDAWEAISKRLFELNERARDRKMDRALESIR